MGDHRGEMKTVTVAERPDLLEFVWEQTSDTMREYNRHGDVLNAYWSRLEAERPEFQFYLLGDADEVLARGHSLPLRWDGSVDDLPEGIDGAIVRGFDEGAANVLCAMLITIPRAFQGRGLSPVAVQAMRQLAARHGLTALIAPVRPNWKERYPLRADRALRRLDACGRIPVRPLAEGPSTGGRDSAQTRASVSADHRHRR